MSNFICNQCGTRILDSENGYYTECKHYPIGGFKMPEIEITDFYIAGVKFYEGQHRANEIDVYSSITLQPDPMNEYDPFAVKVFGITDGMQTEKIMLGYVPKTHSKLIAGLLKKSTPLKASFLNIQPDEKTHKMFRVAISLI